MEKANEYLENEFILWYNNTYSEEARGKNDFHKELSKQEKNDLDSIFSRQTEKVAHNDFTLSLNSKWYPLTKEQPATIQKKDKVIMEERINGVVKIRFKNKYLNFKIILKGLKQVKRDVP
jgi:hypothetical protein